MNTAEETAHWEHVLKALKGDGTTEAARIRGVAFRRLNDLKGLSA